MRVLYILGLIYIFYYIVKKIIFPFTIRWIIKKSQQKMKNPMNHENIIKDDGKIKITYDHDQSKTKHEQNKQYIEGEYINFKEEK